MITLIKKAFWSTLVFFILIIGLVSFLITSTPGLYTVIALSQFYLPGTIKIQRLKGRLLDSFSIEEVNYSYLNTRVKIKNVSVNWDFRALFYGKLPLNALAADSVSIKHNNSQETFKQLTVKGYLDAQSIHITEGHCKHLKQLISLRLNLNRQFPYQLSSKLQVKAPSFQKPTLLLIDLGGPLNALEWTGNFSGLAKGVITGSLQHGRQLAQTITWRDFTWQNNAKTPFTSPEGRLQIEGNLPHLTLTTTAKINKASTNNWQMLAKLTGNFPWDWQFNASLLQPNTTSQKEGLYTGLEIKGVIKDKNHGDLSIKINPGRYQMAEEGFVPLLAFKGGYLHAVLNPQRLSAEGRLTIDEHSVLQSVFALPGFDLSQGLTPKQAVLAQLSMNLNKLDFLSQINPEITEPKGLLHAQFTLKGTLEKNQMEGQLLLTKGSFNLPNLGLQVNSAHLELHSKNKTWQVNGALNSTGKTLTLKGEGAFSDSLKGNLSLQGSDFPIINTKEYQIRTSPNLTLALTPASLAISGKLLVPYARIKPHAFTNSLSLSDDVVFTSDTLIEPPNTNTSMNIQVELGNDVALSLKGLSATLGGSLQVTQAPQGPINAKGELTVQKGAYKAYGQDLAVDQGQLIFTGGRIDNPEINLRASKYINNADTALSSSNQLFDFNSNNLQNATISGPMRVGVEVTGRFTSPKIQLFSNPAMLSQADILSMLVLGRPASQANKAGGQLLLAAISSMNLGAASNSAQLLEQLKQNLGFDFNVQTSSIYNQNTNQFNDTTAFVVGKSLSKRIYLSYNVGLSQADPNVMTLKYLLNKFLSIQITSSLNANGIDFLYTRSKEKAHE